MLKHTLENGEKKNRETTRAKDRLRRTPERVKYLNIKRQEKRMELRKWIDEIKGERGCVDCGYNTNVRALEFDHVRGQKTFNIASMVADLKGKDKILEEITKCEVRCANCHRIRTWGN